MAGRAATTPPSSRPSRHRPAVYLDHRGNGRSEYGDPASWNLDQWGDDVRAFCDALGIVKPIVLGYSFGGMVAQAYATRHPEHPGKMIFYSTSPKVDREEIYGVFERLGGAAARAVAEARWKTPGPESSEAYRQVCSPLYNRRGTRDPDAYARAVRNDAVAFHFAGPDRETARLDFRDGLKRLQCPTLVMAGEDDPITPISRSEIIASCVPAHLVRFARFADAGHGVHNDDPEAAFRVLRQFILECQAQLLNNNEAANSREGSIDLLPAASPPRCSAFLSS